MAASGRQGASLAKPLPKQKLFVVLWMNDGGRPPAVDSADVTIALDNEVREPCGWTRASNRMRCRFRVQWRNG